VTEGREGGREVGREGGSREVGHFLDLEIWLGGWLKNLDDSRLSQKVRKFINLA